MCCPWWTLPRPPRTDCRPRTWYRTASDSPGYNSRRHPWRKSRQSPAICCIWCTGSTFCGNIGPRHATPRRSIFSGICCTGFSFYLQEAKRGKIVIIIDFPTCFMGSGCLCFSRWYVDLFSHPAHEWDDERESRSVRCTQLRSRSINKRETRLRKTLPHPRRDGAIYGSSTTGKTCVQAKRSSQLGGTMMDGLSASQKTLSTAWFIALDGTHPAFVRLKCISETDRFLMLHLQQGSMTRKLLKYNLTCFIYII